jgi:hypothetical protein
MHQQPRGPPYTLLLLPAPLGEAGVSHGQHHLLLLLALAPLQHQTLPLLLLAPQQQQEQLLVQVLAQVLLLQLVMGAAQAEASAAAQPQRQQGQPRHCSCLVRCVENLGHGRCRCWGVPPAPACQTLTAAQQAGCPS